MFDSDYLIRETKVNTYEVSKWTGGKQPEEVYRCSHNKTKWSCTCPARIHSCKHIYMVKGWIKKGKKPFIDEKLMKDFIRRLFR